jgi:acetyl-CoA C-acetyltransferase
MPGTVIVAGARTPIGKLSGALGSFSATDLGGFAIAGALERAGIKPEQVDYVFMGQVIQAGTGQITARQAATKGGIPLDVPASTINKVCLSGLNAIYLADLLINAGEADIVVAGGMESMTQAPYLLPGARAGYRIGDATLVDSMMYDGLFCAFDNCAMGLGTERYNGADGVSRERQDAFSALSHERAAAAIKDGKFAEEIVGVTVPQRKGDPLVVDTDEGVRPETTAESLGKLRPAFDKTGTITAGNASQISDGGAAVIVTSKSKAEELGLSPIGRARQLRPGGRAEPVAPPPAVPCHPRWHWPRPASPPATSTSSRSTRPSPPWAWPRPTTSGLAEDVVNVNGGAIALGHPVGMSGTRLALTALLELKRRGGGGTAAVSLCGGGGQGDAAILRTL